MNNMKPNFLVIGAAKAGTTWLYSCLNAHPEIFLSEAKELHFFSYDRLYQKGFTWYQSHFQSVTNEKAVGEISPSYLPFEAAAERIYAYNPDVRLIMILRNPIDRAYSHYCMAMRTGKVNKDIETGLSVESPYATWGLYHYQITRYTQLFPVNHIKVLLFDDIKRNPESLLKEVYSYLDVDTSFLPESVFKVKNPKRSLPKYPLIYKSLKKIYDNLTTNSDYANRLLTQLRIRGYFDLFHRVNQGQDFPQLSIEKKNSLAQFYAEDVNQLSQFIKKDLLFWLQPYLN